MCCYNQWVLIGYGKMKIFYKTKKRADIAKTNEVFWLNKGFYIDFLDMELLMDMEWILTFASKDSPNSQISILQFDKKGKLDNSATFLSIEVSDIETSHEKAKKLKYQLFRANYLYKKIGKNIWNLSVLFPK